MKMDVERPTRLIDISRLPLDKVEETARRRAAHRRAGARTPISPITRDRAAALSGAVERASRRRLAAAAQHGVDRRQPPAAHALPLFLRYRRRPATNASPAAAAPRSTASIACTRSSARASACIATHPSDMCVALAALEAKVHVAGPAGERTIAVRRFPPPAGRHAAARHQSRAGRDHHRDRAAGRAASPRTTPISRSAIGSPMRSRWSRSPAALELDGGTIKDARLALGGVAHKPWRDPEAEAALRGAGRRRRRLSRRPPTSLLRGAKGFGHNDFKIELARRADRARADAGGARHAAIAVQQEDRVSANAMAQLISALHIPRRRPRQGHRRGEICGRIQRAGPRLWRASSSSTIAKGRITAHRHERGAARRRACSTCSRTRTARRWRTAIDAYQDDVAPDGLAVPAALRRQDHVQRPADRARARRGDGRPRATPRRWCASNTHAEAHVTDLERAARQSLRRSGRDRSP